MRKELVALACAVALALVALPAAAAPLSVTVTGPSSVTIPCGCGNVQWTANPAGGDPPYVAFDWKINGSSVPGSTAILTRNYCNNTTSPIILNDTASVTVTDSNGREASNSKATTITLSGC